MPQTHEDRAANRISVIDEDPLRARREVRELLGELAAADPSAKLNTPRAQPAEKSEKGGVAPELVGLAFSGTTLVVAVVQTWLARVPQRTIVATRADGATLRITGREARQDDQRINRFLSGEEPPADAERGRSTEGTDSGTTGGDGPETGEGSSAAAG